MKGKNIELCIVSILLILFCPAPVFGQSLVLNYSGEAPLPLGSTSMNQTPIIHISDNGNLISLNYPHDPDLFLFEGKGSRIGNTTISAEQSPWISSVSIAPNGQDLIVTQLVPACCHGSVTNTSSNKAILLTRSGEKSWEYPTYNPPTASSFSDSGQKIFIGTNDGRVICLNRNGTPVWTASTDAPVLSLISSADNAAIVVTGESNYFGNKLYGEPFSPHDLSVLDRDGTILWQYQTRGANTAAISKDGSVIAILDTLSGNLMVFDGSGLRLIGKSFTGTPSALAVSGDGDQIVVRTLQGNVYGLDRNGSHTGNFFVAPGSQGIAIDDEDNLVLADGNTIIVYDRKGNCIAAYPLNGAIQSVDVSTDGRSLIVATEHTLVAFSLNKPDRSSETLPGTLIRTPQSSVPQEKTSEKATASPFVPVIATGMCVAVLALFRSFH